MTSSGVVPSVAKVLLPIIFSNVHNLETKRDSTEDQRMDSLDICYIFRGAFDSAKNHKRQRRKRQSVTAKREKSQTPKFL